MRQRGSPPPCRFAATCRKRKRQEHAGQSKQADKKDAPGAVSISAQSRKIVHDSDEAGWSAAEGRWDNEGLWSDVLAVRWNGGAGAKIGNPQSRGLAIWFILPSELDDIYRETIAKLPRIRVPS